MRGRRAALCVYASAPPPRVRGPGSRARPRSYVSENCHYYIAQGADVCGFPLGHVRSVPVAPNGRMRTDVLEDIVAMVRRECAIAYSYWYT